MWYNSLVYCPDNYWLLSPSTFYTSAPWASKQLQPVSRLTSQYPGCLGDNSKGEGLGQVFLVGVSLQSWTQHLVCQWHSIIILWMNEWTELCEVSYENRIFGGERKKMQLGGEACPPWGNSMMNRVSVGPRKSTCTFCGVGIVFLCTHST